MDPQFAAAVTVIGLVAYFVMQQPSRTTLFASLPESEKSRVLDALKNSGVEEMNMSAAAGWRKNNKIPLDEVYYLYSWVSRKVEEVYNRDFSLQ